MMTRRFEQNSIEEIDFPEGQAYMPIASLTCTSSCPAIRGILVSVSEWRATLVNTRYANFILKDSSGQIEGVIFRSMDSKMEESFVIGAEVTVRKAWVKRVKKVYCKNTHIRFELTIPNTLRTLEIRSCPAYDISFNERTLIKDILEKVDLRQLVNVIGVVTCVEKTTDLSRNGRRMVMRDLQIIDESSARIAVTIWNEKAKTFDSPVGTVIAMYQVAQRNQDARQTKSLTLNKNSRIEIDPVSEEASRLKSWYARWCTNNDLLPQKKSANHHSNDGNFESCEKYEPRKIQTMCGSQIESGTNPSSAVVECPFIRIGEVHQSIKLNTKIDTIGVVIREPKERLIRTSSGNLQTIRQIEITDELRNHITVDIWEVGIQDFHIPLHSILLIHQAKVGGHEGQKKLHCLNKHIEVNPKNLEILKLGHIIMKSLLFRHEKDEGRNINEHEKTTNDTSIKGEILYESIGKTTIDTSNEDRTPYISIGVINELCQPGTTVATVGLVVSCEPEVPGNFEQGNFAWTKKLLLRDQGLSEIELVVSGSTETRQDIPLNSMITVKSATIKIEKNRKKLNVNLSDINLAPEKTEIREIEKIQKQSSAFTDENLPCISINKLSNSSIPPKKNITEILVENNQVGFAKPHVPAGNPDVSGKNHFTKIKAINEEIAPGTIIDVLGIIKRRRAPEKVNCSNGAIMKIMVELMDESGDTVWMVIWGSKVDDLEDRENLIVAAKKVQVRCWNNRNELNCSDRIASLIVEPEIPEARKLREWFSSLNSTNDSAKTETWIQPLTSIGNLRHPETSNVLGILLKVKKLREIEQTYFRDVARIIVIMDRSEVSMDVALWGEMARDFAIREGSIIFLSNIKVFGSSSIKGAATPNSTFSIDPPEFQEKVTDLKRWFVQYQCNTLAHSNQSD